ncbi:hypothetical protein [Tautonia sociabilis]|uniref:Secreted protein n=1 Tax=Tautonia sociabilis TaxID=2080755 RepID=A0A432MHH6_9BACT|nr:hypothetical protein [Tautonia sociabilis]RUL86273.1 hypothetical protein TsocGM_16195 [Tautonia sociabilis]
MRSLRPLLLALALLLLASAPGRAQWFWGASSDSGFSGPYAGDSAIWAYPTDLSNGPSPDYSPIFNSAAASRPRPDLKPSPYARSPLDLLRFNRPFGDKHHKKSHRLFGRR